MGGRGGGAEGRGGEGRRRGPSTEEYILFLFFCFFNLTFHKAPNVES